MADDVAVHDRPKRRRVRVPMRVFAALVIIGLVVAGALWFGPRTDDNRPASNAAAGTGTVELVKVDRRDLAATDRYDGTLGYDLNQRVLANQRGVITRAAAEGVTVRAGQELMRIGELPVFLLRGRIPAWRTLRDGVDPGVDVLQLERELVRLGLDRDRDITVDRTFDDGTRRAVERLQDRLSLDETGVVDAGQVVFMPVDARVARRIIDVGGLAPEGAPVLELTSTRRIVTVSISAEDADTAKIGDRATIELPGGAEVSATIRSIATDAQAPAGGQRAAAPVIDIELVLAPKAEVQDLLDSAPVQVRLTTDRAKNVLVVPVTALVALREGGYAVERGIEGRLSDTELVAVRPGLYADGLVEIDSKDLRRGDEVVVPA